MLYFGCWQWVGGSDGGRQLPTTDKQWGKRFFRLREALYAETARSAL